MLSRYQRKQSRKMGRVGLTPPTGVMAGKQALAAPMRAQMPVYPSRPGQMPMGQQTPPMPTQGLNALGLPVRPPQLPPGVVLIPGAQQQLIDPRRALGLVGRRMFGLDY